MTRRRFSIEERRRRLVARHHLGATAPDVQAAVRDVLAMHSSDPLTPYLAARARVEGFAVGDLEKALYEDRTLWRLHSFRRTLWIVAADEAPLVLAAATADISAKERRRVLGWLEDVVDYPASWLSKLEDRVVDAIAGREPVTTKMLGAELPEMATTIAVGAGKWAATVPVSSRVLFLLAMDARIVRGAPAGSWKASQYRWSATEDWFASPADTMPAEEARATLAGRWLARFGPATKADLQWWTGWTARQTAAALTAAGAIEADLDEGSGWVLPDDVEDDLEDDAPQVDSGVVTLLPGLDPTTMGYKQRTWYLGEHGAFGGPLFDRAGNAGPTVWLDGRVVGGWAQRPDGEVVTTLLEDVGRDAAKVVEAEAGRLTAWLRKASETPVVPRFRTPWEKAQTT